MKTRTRTPYERTEAIRAKISASMRRAWQRRRTNGYAPETRVNIPVRAKDARMLPKFGPTPAQALAVLLEGAALLDWNFDPERGWVPSLPMRAAQNLEETSLLHATSAFLPASSSSGS